MTSKNMQMQKDTLVVLLQRCFEPMSTAALAVSYLRASLREIQDSQVYLVAPMPKREEKK